jgi:hypothetical protein
MSIVFDLERTNQLSLLPDKDLVDLCPPIEPYQVTKNHKFFGAVSFDSLTKELPSSVEPGDEDDEIFHNTVSSFLLR